MKAKTFLLIVGLLVITAVFISACQPEPEEVEVTRVVEVEGETITEQVEVTRVVEVEGETQTVEVTRVVEVEAEVQPEYPEGTELHILQWSHFVPQ